MTFRQPKGQFVLGVRIVEGTEHLGSIPVVLIRSDISHVFVASLIGVWLSKRRAVLSIASKEKLN